MSDVLQSKPASNAYGIVSVLKNLGVLLGLYALAPCLAAGSALMAWALTPLIGVVLYRLTMVMHDCGHGTLFTQHRVNLRVGKLLGFVTGVDFGRFRDRHWEHHKCHGVPGDPQGFHYLGTEGMRRGAFVWHLVKPLLVQNVKYVLGESYLSPTNLRSSLARRELPAFIVVQGALMLLVTGAGAYPWLALVPPVAAATFGLFFSQLRGIAEHGVRGTDDDAEGFVRSHAGDWFGRLFLYDVHFHFHEEHHRSPGISSRHLPAMGCTEDGVARTRETMLHTLERMVRTS